MLKRRIAWSLIGATLLFGGCGAEPETADMDIAAFSFGQSGSSLYEFYYYTVAKTETGVSFLAELEGAIWFWM